MQQQLELFRAQLLKINLDLIHLIKERRTTVHQIQNLKLRTTKFPYFDAEREKKIYIQFASELTKLTLKELFSFSLLIESNADPLDDRSYPHFSQGDHLAQKNKQLKLHEQINPILLSIYDANLYKQVELDSYFKNLV